MGSRFTRCLGIAPKVLLNDNYQERLDWEKNAEQPPSVALSFDKGENENAIQNGRDWNEV